MDESKNSDSAEPGADPGSLLPSAVDLFTIDSRPPPKVTVPADWVVCQPLILAATAVARQHHAQYDPSHDFYHVSRVEKLAISIGRSLPKPEPDFLVITLAALFHDLLDSKYQPKGEPVPTAKEKLSQFWAGWGEVIDSERQTLVERIVENVSYSKEIKRIKEGKQTKWHMDCLELHCVQDADKIDALGAIGAHQLCIQRTQISSILLSLALGILRCAAYSAVASRPLHVPSSPISTINSTLTSSAVDHFREKLLRLSEMMKTEKGREIAERRTLYLKGFMEEIELEWEEVAEGTHGTESAEGGEGM
ncbi:uncharacterized protein P7C70_g5924, partial [Phenoliferia sp. Uapishka_3]